MPATPQLESLDFGLAARILQLLDPTDPQHPATKAYVDAILEGFAWKDDVRVASQANVNLTTPGAAIDGITLAVNDRVLIRAQTVPSANGIYVFNGASSAMTRSADADTAASLRQAVTTAAEGTSAGVTFRQSATINTLGTDAVTWQTFGVAAPQASETVSGVGELATQAETDAGTDDLRIVTPLKLASYSGRKRKTAVLFGDGTATTYAITHNFGTKEVLVEVWEAGGQERKVGVGVQLTSTNVVTISTVAAPAVNSLRAVVLA